MKKYTDIMLDIETLGTGTNAAIVQIGAVAFDVDQDHVSNSSLRVNSPGVLLELGQGFRMNVCLADSKHPGDIDPATVEWWLQQSDEARASITNSDNRLGLALVLAMFTEWVRDVGGGGPYDVRLWSNGPTFDEIIIRSAFTRYGKQFPISFRQSRCCRTMYELAQSMGWDRKLAAAAVPDDIVKHDGLGDSVFQARSLVSQRCFVRSGVTV